MSSELCLPIAKFRFFIKLFFYKMSLPIILGKDTKSMKSYDNE